MATTIVGSLRLVAACPVQGAVNGTDNTVTVTVGCAVHLTNVGSRTYWVAVQSNGGSTGTGWIASETRLLYPGQSWTLPAPPTGQQWVILAVPRRRVHAVLERVEIVGLGIAALAAYGGYKLWQDRHSWWQRIRA